MKPQRLRKGQKFQLEGDTVRVLRVTDFAAVVRPVRWPCKARHHWADKRVSAYSEVEFV
jgi:hypothetical protein